MQRLLLTVRSCCCICTAPQRLAPVADILFRRVSWVGHLWLAWLFSLPQFLCVSSVVWSQVVDTTCDVYMNLILNGVTRQVQEWEISCLSVWCSRWYVVSDCHGSDPNNQAFTSLWKHTGDGDVEQRAMSCLLCSLPKAYPPSLIYQQCLHEGLIWNTHSGVWRYSSETKAMEENSSLISSAQTVVETCIWQG